MNQFTYNFAVWLDTHPWSTALHESFYLYNWIETTHVLSLMISLGLLFVVHLRMLGLALTEVPASQVADRLAWPMAVGFALMFITGALLYYAIPVRTSQSLWFRIKLVLIIGAGINAWLFHRRMKAAAGAPASLHISSLMSMSSWVLIVICGRLIAYDWFDCAKQPPAFIGSLAGCIADQSRF